MTTYLCDYCKDSGIDPSCPYGVHGGGEWEAPESPDQEPCRQCDGYTRNPISRTIREASVPIAKALHQVYEGPFGYDTAARVRIMYLEFNVIVWVPDDLGMDARNTVYGHFVEYFVEAGWEPSNTRYTITFERTRLYPSGLY